MKYIGTAVTDVGLRRQTNQDSVCLKIVEYGEGRQIAMAIICDGMGGLNKGEVASASVIQTFDRWFDRTLPHRLDNYNRQAVANEWSQLLRQENQRILNYGKAHHLTLGTTFTGILIVDQTFFIAHVGDTRVYRIDQTMRQLTEDHTFIAREIKLGRMTREQARSDHRRHVLLQCVGASKEVRPQIVFGDVLDHHVFILCSDGFRNKLSFEEIHGSYESQQLRDVNAIARISQELIRRVKERQEQDNISVAVLKCQQV
ncbi:MAG TPA: serine/threonine-protein phosphatase [Clostridiaceae bacterium]|nr:serine/threonine-protein phosphatase [Clostridiaceae bacterium]